MINSPNRLSVDSPQIRSPEKPIRSINRNAVYIAFAIAIAAFGIVLYFLLQSSGDPDAYAAEATAFAPATGGLPALEKMPDSYDEIAEKAYANMEDMPVDEPPIQEQPRNYAYGRQAPHSYGPTPEMRDERGMADESDREAAERSSVMFASAGSSGADRQMPDTVDVRMNDSPPQNGMFFNKSPREYSEKERFLQNNGGSGPKHLRSAPSKYAVMQGTNLPGVLLTEINSDLPGPILAQITTNIFDSKTGRYLLIPQGSKLVGEYNSSVSHGQKRAQVAWTRLILPNTESVDLGRMPGVDSKGASGVEGSVDNHYDDLVIGVLVTSLLSAGVGMSQGPINPTGVSPQQAIGQAVGQEVGRVGTKMADRSLGVQPTLRIASGSKINVFATDDVLLKPYSYK